MALKSPEVETVRSQRMGLARVRIYPAGTNRWLVVGVKRDVTVQAHSLSQLIGEVRNARRASR